MKELISKAIEDFDKLLSLLEKKEESKVGESFRARCRELPSLIEDVGFVAALSFCYAKATKDIYENIRKLIESKSTIKDSDSTKQGYGIYFYLVLKRLKTLGLVKNGLNKPIDVLEELTGKERLANKLIRPYIVQLKRLSEAVFRVEGER
jgi:CRISPR type III-B/RAMP module-associated protein Cmr5